MYDAQTANTLGRKVREQPAEARVELARALEDSKGNIRAAAAKLKVGRTSLYRWLDELGMDRAARLARAGRPLPWLKDKQNV